MKGAAGAARGHGATLLLLALVAAALIWYGTHAVSQGKSGSSALTTIKKHLTGYPYPNANPFTNPLQSFANTMHTFTGTSWTTNPPAWLKGLLGGGTSGG